MRWGLRVAVLVAALLVACTAVPRREGGLIGLGEGGTEATRILDERVRLAAYHKAIIQEGLRHRYMLHQVLFFAQFSQYSYDSRFPGDVRTTSSTGAGVLSYFALGLDLVFLPANLVWYPLQGGTLFGTIRTVEVELPPQARARAILTLVGRGPFYLKGQKVPVSVASADRVSMDQEHEKKSVFEDNALVAFYAGVLEVALATTAVTVSATAPGQPGLPDPEIPFAEYRDPREKGIGYSKPRFSASKIMDTLSPDQFQQLMEDAGFEIDDLELGEEDLQTLRQEKYLDQMVDEEPAESLSDDARRKLEDKDGKKGTDPKGKDTKDLKEPKDAKDAKGLKESKDQKPVKEPKDLKDTKDAKKPRQK